LSYCTIIFIYIEKSSLAENTNSIIRRKCIL